MQQTGSVSTQASYNVSNTIQETSGIQVAPRARDDSANIQSAFNYGKAVQQSGSVSTRASQMDFKIELRSSLVTMIGGMPMGSRGVVMSPNAHDGSSHNAEYVRPS